MGALSGGRGSGWAFFGCSCFEWLSISGWGCDQGVSASVAHTSTGSARAGEVGEGTGQARDLLLQGQGPVLNFGAYIPIYLHGS